MNMHTWNASSNSSTRFPLLLVGVAIAETGGEASFMGVISSQYELLDSTNIVYIGAVKKPFNTNECDFIHSPVARVVTSQELVWRWRPTEKSSRERQKIKESSMPVHESLRFCYDATPRSSLFLSLQERTVGSNREESTDY
nr:unnamed protein product [Callosobruchus analis]